STSYRDNCLPEENSLQHKIPNRSAVAGFTPAGLKMKMTRAPVSVIFVTLERLCCCDLPEISTLVNLRPIAHLFRQCSSTCAVLTR
ncbi:hypothetical protein CH063_02996, partial [Colletotrichum higginsianum]